MINLFTCMHYIKCQVTLSCLVLLNVVYCTNTKCINIFTPTIFSLVDNLMKLK
jgi:hypothetical protein